MFNRNAKKLSQEELVQKMLDIKASTECEEELITKVIDWFATERITREQKHLLFTGLYHRHDMYGGLFTMYEMMCMWHQCDMSEYTCPNVSATKTEPGLLQAVIGSLVVASERFNLSALPV